jgi:hypothetical protein
MNYQTEDNRNSDKNKKMDFFNLINQQDAANFSNLLLFV